FQRVCDLPRERQCFGWWKSGVGLESRALRHFFGERLALDQLEHEGVYAIAIFDAVDSADVRMVQRSEDTCFALEPRGALGIGGAGLRQDLDRDIATELRIAGPIDLAHAAGAYRRKHVIQANASTDQRRGPRRHLRSSIDGAAIEKAFLGPALRQQ